VSGRIRRAQAANPIGGAAAARACNLVGEIQPPTWLAQVTLNQISGLTDQRFHACIAQFCSAKREVLIND
jgi:hypothetical protein